MSLSEAQSTFGYPLTTQVGSLRPDYTPINFNTELTMLAMSLTAEQILQASDSSKNERHGDGQGLTESEEKAIADLEAQIQGAAKKLKNKLKKKIQNIRENAQRRSGGEEHSRTKKR